jgi:hypothetical protein
MTVNVGALEITAINGSGTGLVSFSVYKSGAGNREDRWLAAVLLEDFSANTGKWFSGWRVTGRNLDFTNTLAWSAQGTFKRFTNSLYFYSDDSRKPNAQMADFVLYLAPAFPQDVLNNWSGVGKITNPRNPSWCGLALEWKRNGSGPPPDDE